MARVLRNGRAVAAVVPAPTRCAIYTRKSTEEGLDRDFNSLDNQREAAEAYIQSQRHEGWEALPDRYDDGGFTGANTERPALKRLLADVEVGSVNCVVVYKLDRPGYSLLEEPLIALGICRSGLSMQELVSHHNQSLEFVATGLVDVPECLIRGSETHQVGSDVASRFLRQVVDVARFELIAAPCRIPFEPRKGEDSTTQRGRIRIVKRHSQPVVLHDQSSESSNPVCLESIIRLLFLRCDPSVPAD